MDRIDIPHHLLPLEYVEGKYTLNKHGQSG